MESWDCTAHYLCCVTFMMNAQANGHQCLRLSSTNMCTSYDCWTFFRSRQGWSAPQWSINIESCCVLYSLPSDPEELARSHGVHTSCRPPCFMSTARHAHCAQNGLCRQKYLNWAHKQNIHLWLLGICSEVIFYCFSLTVGEWFSRGPVSWSWLLWPGGARGGKAGRAGLWRRFPRRLWQRWGANAGASRLINAVVEPHSWWETMNKHTLLIGHVSSTRLRKKRALPTMEPVAHELGSQQGDEGKLGQGVLSEC